MEELNRENIVEQFNRKNILEQLEYRSTKCMKQLGSSKHREEL